MSHRIANHIAKNDAQRVDVKFLLVFHRQYSRGHPRQLASSLPVIFHVVNAFDPVRRHKPSCPSCKRRLNFLGRIISRWRCSSSWRCSLQRKLLKRLAYLLQVFSHLLLVRLSFDRGLCKTEVSDFYTSVFVNEDVLRLQISVNHLVRMDTMDPACNLSEKLQILFPIWFSSVFNQRLERVLWAVLHLYE